VAKKNYGRIEQERRASRPDDPVTPGDLYLNDQHVRSIKTEIKAA
jgi:hypothetical protein